MKRVLVPTYQAAIFIAGDAALAKATCRAFCDAEGLCVTVEPTDYVYTNGGEAGVRVGLINYGRFPSQPAEVFDRAERLAMVLLEALDQQSFSIVATDQTIWFSRRPENG